VITDRDFEGDGSSDMNSSDIHRYFFGIDYPAHRDDLVRIIKQAGAPEDDVRRVRTLPSRNYTGLFDVSNAIDQSQVSAGTAQAVG
jgi:hypothetical protein